MSFLQEVKGDFERHGRRLSHPGLWVLAVHRLGRKFDEVAPTPGVQRALQKVYGGLRLALDLTVGTELGKEVILGEDFCFLHHHNIHIHPRAVIGDRVSVMHDVTVGTNGNENEAPIIGNDVFIGAGAKVLGAIRVGDGAKIGANSLVITDVPAGVTVMGVPARVSPFSGEQKRARVFARRPDGTIQIEPDPTAKVPSTGA